MEERIKKLRDEHEARQLRELHKHAAEINAQIISDRPGVVRVDGPRRQHSAEVINGALHLTEI